MKKTVALPISKVMFSFRKIFFVLSILFASSSYALDVTVSSVAELKSYLNTDNLNLTMTPGEYRITSASGFTPVNHEPSQRNVLLYFQGNDNTFDFTGVTFIVETAIFQAFGNYKLYEFNIVGNNNVLKNLTLVDEGDTRPSSSAVNYVIDGSNNRLEGFHTTSRGSYPYGYGDAFGKGGGSVIKHYKHSACLVRGRNNHVKDCTFIHRSYGHCIFFQAAESPLVEGCYVEGEMRSTDDMLAEEGTGSPADNVDFMTVWDYKLPAGFMMSLGEAGIRAYNAGNTVINGVASSGGTSNPVVRDCTVKYMRTAFGLHQATGTETIENCIAIGNESAYDGGIVKNCIADISYGPAFNVSANNLDMEVKIIQTLSTTYNGEGRIASIAGSGSTFKITGDGTVLDPSLKLQIGGGVNSIRHQPGSALEYQITYTSSNNSISNGTSADVVLDAQSSNITGTSCGTILDSGSNNTVTLSDCTFGEESLLKVGDTFTENDIDYEVISVSPLPNEVTVTGTTLIELNIPATVVETETAETFSVTQIRSGAFYNNSIITSLVTPNTLKKLPAPEGNAGTFRNTTSFMTADFSASTSLTALPAVLFRASAIKSVILPSSLTELGVNTFRDCTNLTSVELKNPTPVNIGTNVFTNLTLSGIQLTVPAATKTAFEETAIWQDFGNITEASALNTINIEKEFGLSLYPNPTNGLVYIKNSQGIDVTITIYELNGRALLSKKIGNVNSSINITNLASGMYLIKTASGTSQFMKRILKL